MICLINLEDIAHVCVSSLSARQPLQPLSRNTLGHSPLTLSIPSPSHADRLGSGSGLALSFSPFSGAL